MTGVRMMLQAYALSPSVTRLLNHGLKSADVFSSRFCKLKTRTQMRNSRVECFSGGGYGAGFVKKRFSFVYCQDVGYYRFCLSESFPELLLSGFAKVVEHLCLFKAKEGLSEDEEKNMLDYLYTSQYQMRGIVSISVGRIEENNKEAYTHALYVRFQKKEDIVKFYDNPFQLKILKEHVSPYCHGQISLDFESEVEDDIIPIFRKGEEFNYGIEFVLLLAFSERASKEQAEDAMTSFARIIEEFPSLIVQSTQGRNFNISSEEEYTDVIVIRFQSDEAFEIFTGSTEYKAVWKSKFEPFTLKSLAIHYSINPVGTNLI